MLLGGRHPGDPQTIHVWGISGVGQIFAGNFIQIPSIGYGVAIPVVNPAVSKNGGATLSDDDLCGIFSGKLTDFSQITDARVTWSGPITVTYYASQGQGITYTLTYPDADVPALQFCRTFAAKELESAPNERALANRPSLR